jgi:hypothetical protein
MCNSPLTCKPKGTKSRPHIGWISLEAANFRSVQGMSCEGGPCMVQARIPVSQKRRAGHWHYVTDSWSASEKYKAKRLINVSYGLGCCRSSKCQIYPGHARQKCSLLESSTHSCFGHEMNTSLAFCTSSMSCKRGVRRQGHPLAGATD